MEDDKIIALYWARKEEACLLYTSLSMDCFWAEVTKGHLELKEAEAAKWLTKDRLDSVAWLPADITLIDKIQGYLK